MDLLSNLAIRLNDACNSKPELLSKGFNISAAGFGIGINADESSTDYVGIIERTFRSIVKHGRKVLITIDEVIHDNNMKIFASQFQIFLRQDFSLFLIMTGLHENIYEIQNDPALTFLLRSPKIVTGSLSILQIIKQYKSIFKIDENDARELAYLTKGYAFAFQALGVSYWNNRASGMDTVLGEFDELLDDFVYKKIWSSLTTKEREIFMAIEGTEEKVSDICGYTGISSSSFSKYREHLISKGLMESPRYGYVAPALPRFNEVIRNYII